MIGSMVPTEPMGDTLDKMVKEWQARRHYFTHRDAWECDAVLLGKATGKGEQQTPTETPPWYPSVETMKQSQQEDPECQSIIEQMKTMSVGGNAALKKKGISQDRMRYLQLHAVDPDGTFACSGVSPLVSGRGTMRKSRMRS